MVKNSAVNYTSDMKKALIAYDIPAIDHLTNRYCINLELNSEILSDVEFNKIYQGILGCMDFFTKIMKLGDSVKGMKEFNEKTLDDKNRAGLIDQYGKWVTLINQLYEMFVKNDQKPMLTLEELSGKPMGFKLFVHNSNRIEFSEKFINTNKYFDEIKRFEGQDEGRDRRDYLIIMENLRPLLQFNVKVNMDNKNGIIYLQWDIVDKMFFDEDIMFNPNFKLMTQANEMPEKTHEEIADKNRKLHEIRSQLFYPVDDIVSLTKMKRKEDAGDENIAISVPFIAINSLISGARASFSRNLREDSKFNTVNRSVFIIPPEFALAPNFVESEVYSFKKDLPLPEYKFILDSANGNNRFVQTSAPRDIEDGVTFEEILIRNYLPAYSILKYYASIQWNKIIEKHNEAVLSGKSFDLIESDWGDELYDFRPRFKRLAKILEVPFDEYYAIVQVKAETESLGEMVELMTGQSRINEVIQTMEKNIEKITTDINLVNTPILDKNGVEKKDKDGNVVMRIANPEIFRKRIEKILENYLNLIRSSVIYAIPANESGYLQAKELLKFRLELVNMKITAADLDKIILTLKNHIDSINLCIDLSSIKEDAWPSYFKYTISVSFLFQIANLMTGIENKEPLQLLFDRLRFENELFKAFELLKKMETGVGSSCVISIPTKPPIIKKKKGKKTTGKKSSAKKPDVEKKESEPKSEGETAEPKPKASKKKTTGKKTTGKKSSAKKPEVEKKESEPKPKASKKKTTGKKTTGKKSSAKKPEFEKKESEPEPNPIGRRPEDNVPIIDDIEIEERIEEAKGNIIKLLNSISQMATYDGDIKWKYNVDRFLVILREKMEWDLTLEPDAINFKFEDLRDDFIELFSADIANLGVLLGKVLSFDALDLQIPINFLDGKVGGSERQVIAWIEIGSSLKPEYLLEFVYLEEELNKIARKAEEKLVSDLGRSIKQAKELGIEDETVAEIEEIEIPVEKEKSFDDLVDDMDELLKD